MLLGTYDPVADVASDTGGAIADPATMTLGEYYIVTANGVCTSPFPDINGVTLGVGDWVIVTGSPTQVWTPVRYAAEFLSSQADDTAEGIITFNQRPIGALAAQVNNELARKGEVDAGDAQNDANLAVHAGDTSIHYLDAPANGIVYARQDNAWVPSVGVNFGILYGDANSMTVSGTRQVVQGYDNELGAGNLVGQLDPIAGTITLPTAGLYNLTAWVIGAQGNNTKEESMLLALRVAGGSNPGDFDLWAFDVATDKTNVRSFTANITFVADQPNIVLSLIMYATAGMGTFNFDNTSFRVTQLVDLGAP